MSGVAFEFTLDAFVLDAGQTKVGPNPRPDIPGMSLGTADFTEMGRPPVMVVVACKMIWLCLAIRVARAWRKASAAGQP